LIDNLGTLICVGTATLSVFLGSFLVLLRSRFNVSKYVILIYFGVATFSLYAILDAFVEPRFIMLPLFVYCGLLPAFVYLFVDDVVRDSQHKSPTKMLLLGLMAFLLVVQYLYVEGSSPYAQPVSSVVSAFKAATLFGALWLLTANWSNDLINSRIEFRIKLIITTVLLGFFILAVEALRKFGVLASETENSVGYSVHLALFIAMFWSGLKMLSIDNSVALLLSRNMPLLEKNENAISFDADKAAKLKQIITEEEVYRINGLTVADLAEKLDMKEYQLRNLINRTLGHRNFTEFLNEFRLTYVTKKLLETDLPILSIALDAGYKSISPFNRAFKAKYGMTPSQYRLKALPTEESTA